jgi:hypothetical protein
MGRNKRRHANARAEVPSGGVQKWGLRQVERKLSIRVYMTVKQWRQRTAIFILKPVLLPDGTVAEPRVAERL